MSELAYAGTAVRADRAPKRGGQAPRHARPPSPRAGADRTRARRRSFDFGVAAEGSVARYLHAGGYHIVSQRERRRSCEIDVIAARDGVVALVEVKARSRGWSGWEAVDSRKQRRMSRAADEWLADNPDYGKHTIRFDVALVWPGGRLEYLENAFDAVPCDEFRW